MNEQLSIMSMVDAILKKWYILFIAAIAGGLFAYVFTDLFIPPKYSSSTTLYVSASPVKGESVSASNISASKVVVKTYSEILKARNFLGKIAREMNGKYTADDIKGMLSVGAVNETEVLSIKILGENKNDVYKMVQLFTEYAADELKNVMGGGEITVLETPLEPQNPVSPNIRMITIIGVAAGLLLASLVIVVISLLDTRIKSGEEFANMYEEPLLGEIPTLEEYQLEESRG